MTGRPGWICAAGDDGMMHVRPIEALRPHAMDERCWCRPTLDEGVFVHGIIPLTKGIQDVACRLTGRRGVGAND